MYYRIKGQVPLSIFKEPPGSLGLKQSFIVPWDDLN